jgi:methylthioribose-1-phosphate isomerase
MLVDGKPYRTVWTVDSDSETIWIIDQRHLPFQFIEEPLRSVEDVAVAIKDMHVRGAGCIGATAGFGMYLATMEATKSDDFEASLKASAEQLKSTRPTAVNLSWAVDRLLREISQGNSNEEKQQLALQAAQAIADEDVAACQSIGQHGLKLIQEIVATKGKLQPVNILTHCNAGWLAFVDCGSAIAPIYAAHDAGIPVHVWVDETRPRNQGARLTAWELASHGVPHTIIPDNAAGHLMQHGQVDLVITGTDRTSYTGDVANKIGTYLKALAAKDNDVPFYVALPSSTFDWQIRDGVKEIPIEERHHSEVTHISGLADGPKLEDEIKVRLTPDTSHAANPAFDVTPSRLLSGLITEKGICEASETGISKLFPDKQNIL